MTIERSDEALMLAYRDGDARAFELLHARHRARLYRWLVHQCGDRAIAEELYQDIWLKVINARGGYEITAKFTTWLFRIAHNRLIDHWRAQGKDMRVEPGGAEDDGGDDPIERLPGNPLDEPHVDHERKRLGAALLREIEALPAVQRETFLLSQETDMTLEEIASVTGVNRETAKSRLRYAMAKLRKQLQDWR